MSSYAWIITRDFLVESNEDFDTEESEVGVIGPDDVTDLQINKLQAGLGYRFRIYDGDDELYYEGRIVFDPELEAGEVEHRPVVMNPGDKEIMVCCGGLPEEAFGPLDWARWNAGAVTIRYFDKQGRLGVL